MSKAPKTPANILPKKLAKGYRSFRDDRLPDEKKVRRKLADGQHPPTLLIGCVDSRAAIEQIFDADPGDILVMRNIAALVPPYGTGEDREETSAAIEFAVRALKVKQIVVMGHAKCGGISTYTKASQGNFEPLSPANFVGKWAALIEPAMKKVGPPPEGNIDNYCETLGHASVVQSLENLRTYPFVKEKEEAKELTLYGAYFGVVDGELEALDAKTGKFFSIAPATS